ncbi:hypothetical protein Pflav_010730 [Phytohabitans flavus]|uniref:Outer membrane channel protein CpnT-like N-terminal domain-containing protein n=1 Tax=Phytohabitans flavus TaxID=1076124 RepID=A0A6F8XLI1_9ACTN|nr:hypothetical protein Pflav_010730 [Phytohabitans flavus]
MATLDAHHVPPDLQNLLMMLVGNKWPTGHEELLRTESLAWHEVAAAVHEYAPRLAEARQAIQDGLAGPVREVLDQYMAGLVGSGEHDEHAVLPVLASCCESAAHTLWELAAEIERLRITIIVLLIILAIQLAIDMFWLLFGGAAAAVEHMIATRVTIMQWIRRALASILTRVAESVLAQVGVGLLAEVILLGRGHITEIKGEALRTAAMNGAVGSATGSVFGLAGGAARNKLLKAGANIRWLQHSATKSAMTVAFGPLQGMIEAIAQDAAAGIPPSNWVAGAANGTFNAAWGARHAAMNPANKTPIQPGDYLEEALHRYIAKSAGPAGAAGLGVPPPPNVNPTPTPAPGTAGTTPPPNPTPAPRPESPPPPDAGPRPDGGPQPAPAQPPGASGPAQPVPGQTPVASGAASPPRGAAEKPPSPEPSPSDRPPAEAPSPVDALPGSPRDATPEPSSPAASTVYLSAEGGSQMPSPDGSWASSPATSSADLPGESGGDVGALPSDGSAGSPAPSVAAGRGRPRPGPTDRRRPGKVHRDPSRTDCRRSWRVRPGQSRMDCCGRRKARRADRRPTADGRDRRKAPRHTCTTRRRALRCPCPSGQSTPLCTGLPTKDSVPRLGSRPSTCRPTTGRTCRRSRRARRGPIRHPSARSRPGPTHPRRHRGRSLALRARRPRPPRRWSLERCRPRTCPIRHRHRSRSR